MMMPDSPQRRLRAPIRCALYIGGLTAAFLASFMLFEAASSLGAPRKTAYAAAADQQKSVIVQNGGKTAALTPSDSSATGNTVSSSGQTVSDLHENAVSADASVSDAAVPEEDQPVNPADESSSDMPEENTTASQNGDKTENETGTSGSAQRESALTDTEYGFPVESSTGLKKTILIDPGHGGDDVGDGAKDGTLEKNVTLDFARRLKTHLEKQNPDLQVILSRDNDSRLADSAWNDLSARLDLQDDTNCDYMISIHAHAETDPAASGELIIRNDDDSITAVLAQKIGENLRTVGYLPDRGVLSTSSYPLKMISMSNAHAIELDLLNLGNESDLAVLKDSTKMDQAAAAVASAISRTIVENPDAPGYVSRQEQNRQNFMNGQ